MMALRFEATWQGALMAHVPPQVSLVPMESFQAIWIYNRMRQSLADHIATLAGGLSPGETNPLEPRP